MGRTIERATERVAKLRQERDDARKELEAAKATMFECDGLCTCSCDEQDELCPLHGKSLAELVEERDASNERWLEALEANARLLESLKLHEQGYEEERAKVDAAEAEAERLRSREQQAISILTHAVDDIDGDDLLELCRRLELDCNAEHERAMAAEAEAKQLQALAQKQAAEAVSGIRRNNELKAEVALLMCERGRLASALAIEPTHFAMMRRINMMTGFGQRDLSELEAKAEQLRAERDEATIQLCDARREIARLKSLEPAACPTCGCRAGYNHECEECVR